MDLKTTIATEHSKKQCLKVVDYVAHSRTRFKELMRVFADGPYRISQRAAWPISICIEKHPELIEGNFPILIQLLKEKNAHVSVTRNILRLLQFVNIPKKFHGEVMDLCFSFLQDKKQPVAVRVFAMTVIDHLSSSYPEIKNELFTILEDQLDYTSAGFRSRASKILRARIR